MHSKILLLLLLLLPTLILSSKGDTHYYFQWCLRNCHKQGCANGTASILYLYPWTCDQECQYNCMWSTEKMNRALYYPILKYYGKWPFLRILGLQEPFSVLFSLGNGYFHLKALLTSKILFHPSLPLYFRFFHYSLVFSGVNLWFWSALFHARETKFTEVLDYCSVNFFVMNLFLLGFYRYLFIYI